MLLVCLLLFGQAMAGTSTGPSGTTAAPASDFFPTQQVGLQDTGGWLGPVVGVLLFLILAGTIVMAYLLIPRIRYWKGDD